MEERWKDINSRLGEVRKNNKGTPMRIIKYNNSDDIDVEFLDKFRYVKEHQSYSNFVRGQIKNAYDRTVYGVGYIGVGIYKPMKNKDVIETRYNDWRNMLGRCYSEDEREYDVYHHCKVDERWHNYQNFSQWFEENKYPIENERLQVDKDILIPCNTIYSPETCLLVPNRINALFINKPNKRGLPNGITKVGLKYSAKYNNLNLGTYYTVEEAFDVYAKAKKDNIIRFAFEYKNILPAKVFDALIRYEVKIENDKNYLKS